MTNRYKKGVFGWDAVELANHYTIEELSDLRETIENDPANKATGFYLYTPKARKKLDAIAWAITYLLKEKRIARGETVVVNGYSGRNSNRRR